MVEPLQNQGYATGQLGKNHLGDLNQFLTTVHGEAAAPGRPRS